MKKQSVISLVKTGIYSYENKKAIRNAVVDALNRIKANEVLHPGQTVLIKPNLVSDINYNKQGGILLFIYSTRGIEPVVEYICQALKGTGTIIIGDAPVQECNFENLRGIHEIAKKYQNCITDIEVLDFRELFSVIEGGIHKAVINKKSKRKNC